jgi:hypothetical protein
LQKRKKKKNDAHDDRPNEKAFGNYNRTPKIEKLKVIFIIL